MAQRDDLAKVIADNLNKIDDEQIAFFLADEISPTHLTDFISTGSSILDLAISNRPNGGIACGRITELQGLEGSGKSLVAAHMLADTQKRGGVGVLIDTETALNYDFFDAVGLDFSKMIYVNENKVENIFEAIVRIIESVRKSDKDKLVTIVVDSLSAATTEVEEAEDFGRTGYATVKPIIISKALRKITKLIADQKIALVFTNQLRMKMNAMPFSDPYTTSGGKALSFHASTRVRFALAGTVKSNNYPVGVKVKAKVTKNRLGPPYREAEFIVLFDRGIDDISSWYDVLKQHNLIKTKGAWATWKDPDTDEEIKFQKNTIETELLNDEDRKSKIYDQICDKMLMAYSNRDEMEVTNEVPEDM